ncbi:MAG: lipoyl protein ligase domain-containing protein [Candidatus Muiribacteriota bacterium]
MIIKDFGVFEAEENMQIDLEMLQKAYTRDDILFRIYGWKNLTVSLGKFQKVDKSIIKKLKTNGISVVKRPSGGRAVIHKNDLTYAFAAPLSFFKEKSVKKLYMEISAPIIETIENFSEKKVKINTGMAKNYFNKNSCFSSVSLYELQDEVGRKILGSAQTRTAGGVLQHGSIYYDYPPEISFFLPEYNKKIAVVKEVFEENFKKALYEKIRSCFSRT